MKNLFILMIISLLLTGCTTAPGQTSEPTNPPELSTVESDTPAPLDTEETEAVQITLMKVFYPDENAINFLTTVVEGDNLTFLDAMIQVGVLNEEININTITIEESHLTIDFNAAFRDLVCTMGTSGERMIIGSVVNTLIENYGVDSISITVDGDIWESGHVIYDFPMGFFE